MSVQPIYFFAVAGFLMDTLFNCGVLVDAYFADSVFNASQSTQGVLGGVSAVGHVIGCLIFGVLSVKLKRKTMTVFTVSVLLLCFAALMFCGSLRTLLFLMIAKRFIVAMYWPALMAWLADVSIPGNLGKNLCAFNVGWASGNVAGSWIAGHLGEWMAAVPGGYNAQASYGASAILCLTLLAWLLIVNPKRSNEDQTASAPLTTAGVRLFLLQGWVAHFAVFCTIALLVFMFPRLAAMPHLELSAARQTSLHALRDIVTLSTFLALYFTSAWHFRFYPVYAGLGFCACGILSIGFGPNYGAVLMGQCLIGLSAGILYSVSQYYSLRLPREKGKGGAMHEALIGLAYVAGPALGGTAALFSHTPRMPFAAALMPIGIAALALVWIRSQVHDGRSIHQAAVEIPVAVGVE